MFRTATWPAAGIGGTATVPRSTPGPGTVADERNNRDVDAGAVAGASARLRTTCVTLTFMPGAPAGGAVTETTERSGRRIMMGAAVARALLPLSRSATALKSSATAIR